ncbi:hypothetical protein R3P38DRAFT_3251527 [Favolaschia claudopus]|uniref:Uncharacterized protein n=1 Tax=Favolaschia claudopus TaxID=2862362 RepID=A0AAW0EAM5_9AGAR
MLTLQTHSLESLRTPGLWPPQISRVYDLLQLSLPPWCPSESSSPDRMSISPELGPVAANSSDESEENARLRDFYPFAAHTVDAVNSAMLRNGPQTVWPFVRGFTKVLVATCSENAALLSHASFVLPRSVAPRDDIFDGVAEMLACHIVEGFETESSEMNDENSSSSGVASMQASTPAPHPSQDDPNEFMDSDSAEISTEESVSDHSATERSDCFFSASGRFLSSTSGKSIDVSLNGHIFQGGGKHSFALLPFLCFADGENIIGIVSSVACQRFVWGISEPTVGFLLSSSGSTMELVLSWVDQSRHVLHVVHDFGQGSKIGCFDFSSVTSILRFSQFLFGVSASFRLVASIASRLCENNRLAWRSDCPQSKDLETGIDRVALWVQDTQFWSNPQSPSSDPPGQQAPRGVDGRHQLRSTASDKAEIQPRQGAPGPSDTEHGKILTVPTRTASSTFDKEKKTPGKSGSQLFTKDETTTTELNLLTYAADRHVRFLTKLDHEKDDFGDEGMEIAKQTKLYDQLTAFQWYSTNLKDPFPNVAGARSSYEDALFGMAKHTLSQISDLAQKSEHELTPEHEEIIKQQVFTLLYASAGAGAEILPLVESFEAESRHDWDALLLSFYVATRAELVSRNVLFERTLHYPKNKLVEEEDATKLTEAVQAEEFSSTSFQHKALTEAANQSSVGSALYRQAFLAAAQSMALWSSYAAACGPVHNKRIPLQDMLRERSRREPRTGTCDALCFFAVSSGSLQEDKIKALEFITLSKAEIKAGKEAASTSEEASQTTDHNLQSRMEGGQGGISQGPELNTKLTDQDRKYYQQNPHTSCRGLNQLLADATGIPKLKFPETDLSSFEGKLLFPYFIVEHKKKHDTEAKALNQVRLSLMAVISYYAALNILGRPFYALVTNGPKGAILMGWKSEKSERIYVVDRNVVQFDISKPIEAYHCATFLLRLREEQKEFEKIVRAKVAELEKDFDHKEFQTWRKEWQIEHLDKEWVTALSAAAAGATPGN